MDINKKIKVLDFKLSKILNGGLFGAYKSKFSGSGMEFSEHKEYHFGDQVKNIDWKASNKTGEMYIKQYEEERDLNVLFFLDNSSSMSFGSNNITKKDLLTEIFYGLSLSAYNNNDNIGGAILNENEIKFIDYKKSKNNIFRIIDILESSKLEDNNGIKNKFNNILKYLINKKINNNLIFILTDNISEIDEKLLRLVENKNEIIIINIFDYFENNLSEDLVELVINNNKEFLNIDIYNKSDLEKYKKNRENNIRYIKSILDRHKVGYIKIETKDDAFKEIMGYFNKVKK